MIFLKTILIIVLLYYFFKVLAKMFVPKILGYAMRKTEQHFKERYGPFAQKGQYQEEQQVGNIIIDKKKFGKTKKTKKVGEYIDFEEVK